MVEEKDPPSLSPEDFEELLGLHTEIVEAEADLNALRAVIAQKILKVTKKYKLSVLNHSIDLKTGKFVKAQ